MKFRIENMSNSDKGCICVQRHSKMPLLGGLALFIFATIIGVVVFETTSNILDFYILLGMGVVILAWIIYARILSRPIEVCVGTKEFSLRYRLLGAKSHSFDEIAWMNTWPGGHGTHAYSRVKLDDGKLFSVALDYETGKTLREAYEAKFGTRPLNYDQYIRANGEQRWFSVGPSE